MKMTHEARVLKTENASLLAMLQDLQTTVAEAARNGTPLHDLERTLWQQLLRLGRALLGQFLDTLGSGDLGPTLTLPEGRCLQRLPHPHARRYVSIFGEFQLERTAYGSREGQKMEFVPLDNRLQLPDSVFSYVLQDWDQGLCVEQSFGQASHTVAKILGLSQAVDSLERMNVQMAESVDAFRAERTLPAPEEEGEIVVSSADGKGVVLRRGADEPRPPVHRTKGDKASRKAMALVGAVYSVERHRRTAEEVVAALFDDDREVPPRPRPRPCHKQVIANLTLSEEADTASGLETTYLWLMEEVWARNRNFGKEMVHLCDGQEALWEARRQYLPRRNLIDILDLLHVTPRLWQAAHVFYAEKGTAAEHFVRERVLRVLHGKAAWVVRGLRQMGRQRRLTGSKKKTLTKVCAYLANNLERMHYDVYLAKGYPIASGVIEGACRHLVKDRMERAGMHWTRRGAQAMLDVRSIHVNGDWDAYQAFRIRRQMEKLYPWRALVEGTNFELAV